MPRQDVPYGGAICRLKERIAEIWDKLGEKLHTINGVPGDGDGNVKIVSGSSAVVINNDPTQNEIEVSLDTSQLPAASVSSVNGQTGAVALDAGDITSDGNSDVQSDIDALQTMDGALQGNINAEALARQNADSALQTNINSSNGRISVLEGEDANNMKLNRNQTAAGDNTFTGRLKAQGQPAYSPSQPTDDVATIGTLDAYIPMIRTTGNQTKAGQLILQGGQNEQRVTVKSTNIDLNNPGAGTKNSALMSFTDVNDNWLAYIYVSQKTDKSTALIAWVRNADGSTKSVTIAEGS